MLSERRRSVLNLVGIDREGQVLRGPFPFVFLQHEHASLASGSQEEPGPAFVPQAYFQTKHVPIEGFGPGKLFHGNGHFIQTADG